MEKNEELQKQEQRTGWASPISRPNATSPRCMTKKRGEIDWDVASSKSSGTLKSRTYLSNSKIFEYGGC